MNRQEFLQQLFGLTAALAVPPILRSAYATERESDLAGRRLPRRKFGTTGVDLPVLGVGGAHLGQADNEKAARAIVDAALEEGVRFFDTAQVYQNGRSEQWIGAGLKGARDQAFLQ